MCLQPQQYESNATRQPYKLLQVTGIRTSAQFYKKPTPKGRNLANPTRPNHLNNYIRAGAPPRILPQTNCGVEVGRPVTDGT